MAHDDPNQFESRLTDGTDRFLSHLLEHAFAIGRRTGHDFLRHFPPPAIMEALKNLPALRADILESATGVRRKIALKKSAFSAGEDLQIALEEGEAATADVVGMFRPDDRVRYLPRRALWAFLIEGEFWKASKTDKFNYDRAQQHLAYMLDRALKDELLTHQDVIDGISINKISQLMPRSELEMALDKALSAGRAREPFTDRDLYENLTAVTITTHIPLPHIWNQIIHPSIAVAHDLADSDGGQVPAVEEAETQKSADVFPAHSGSSNPPAEGAPSLHPAILRTPKPTTALRRLQAQAGMTWTATPEDPPQDDTSAKNESGSVQPSKLREDVAFDFDFEEELNTLNKT